MGRLHTVTKNGWQNVCGTFRCTDFLGSRVNADNCLDLGSPRLSALAVLGTRPPPIYLDRIFALLALSWTTGHAVVIACRIPCPSTSGVQLYASIIPMKQGNLLLFIGGDHIDYFLICSVMAYFARKLVPGKQ